MIDLSLCSNVFKYQIITQEIWTAAWITYINQMCNSQCQ